MTEGHIPDQQHQPDQQNRPDQPPQAPSYAPIEYQPPSEYQPPVTYPAAYQATVYPPAPYRPTFYPPPETGYGAPVPTAPSTEKPTTGKPSSRGPVKAIVAAGVIAAVVGGGIGAGTVAALDHNRTVASNITFSTATAQNTAKIDGTVTAAAAKIQPSVVTINVAGQSESGTGSGVILRPDGYILTNNHVVSVAGTGGKIQVITTDGQSGTATIVGTDQSDDLAVIKVSGLANLTAATFASSSSLQVGQSVVAIGAPLGLSNTVTSGIVSNTARPVQTGDNASSQAVFDAIQTDAAINPGNSGGPLVNLNGDVVGINAAIATANSGGVQVPGQTTQSGSIGIGFAIPSDEASRIAAELIANGKATHAIIGVQVSTSSSQTSIVTVGATISAVTADGAAAKAGLQVGDVVTKVENQLILANVDLVAAIRSFAPNQTVTLTYTRGGSAHTVKVTLGTASS
jgi:putative serine protease PepD